MFITDEAHIVSTASLSKIQVISHESKIELLKSVEIPSLINLSDPGDHVMFTATLG